MSTIELRPNSHGKVRDIYDCGDSLLMVASDRISAYDFILPDEIPYKGEILTRISAFWFERFADLSVSNDGTPVSARRLYADNQFNELMKNRIGESVLTLNDDVAALKLTDYLG